jgi:uncharacterized protein (TIGR03790 family)
MLKPEYLFIVIAARLLITIAEAAEQPLAAATIVLYNKAAPDSVQLAKFYAQQRGIARDHLVGLTCSTEEEISREEYDTTIADPLREIFKTRHWWTLHETPDQEESVTASSIHFVAVIKGIPLKIRATADYPGDVPRPGPMGNRNEASVDSELTVLAFMSHQVSGLIPNPYFQNFRAIGDVENATMLLVCRLDAPAAVTVRRMIVDAIAAEKSGLWGRAYVDGAHNASGGMEVGDQWLAQITGQLHKVGIPVVYDETPAIFPEGYPMTDCALYYGWYAGAVAGPFTRLDFRFLPGAVAVHIHSFSANTLRDPNANWVAPLVTKGAAASLGNVYEPFLQLTSHLDIFNDRLLHGFTFAESAYMSIPALSWMSVMVGDPLYRPYASWLQIDAPRDSAKSGTDWKTYHEFAVKNVTRPVSEFRTVARQVASRSRNCPMIEDLGLMEARDGNFSAAASYFQQARTCYAKRDDLLRVVLEEADAWIKQNKPKRALALVRSVLRVVPDAPAAPLLRKIEQDLTASSSAPSATVRP